MLTNAGEPVLICPYNKAHSILKSRMQFHLAKCRQQSANSEHVECPFNSTHVLPRIEIEFHKQVCENRTIIDTDMYDNGRSRCPVDIPSTPPEAYVSCEENWDEDPAESVLEVVKKIAKQRKVYLPINVASKAEKKAHRLQERLRFQRVSIAEETQRSEENRNSRTSMKGNHHLNDISEKKRYGVGATADRSGSSTRYLNKASGNYDRADHSEIDRNGKFSIKEHKSTQDKQLKRNYKQQIHQPPVKQKLMESNEDKLLTQMSKLELKENRNDRENTRRPRQFSITSTIERHLKRFKVYNTAWEQELNMRACCARTSWPTAS